MKLHDTIKASLQEAKTPTVHDAETLEHAKQYDLHPDMVHKMRNGDHHKLIYQWVKTGHADLKTFKKLLDYSSGS